jgi:pyrimidine deaminase RibD-like protein
VIVKDGEIIGAGHNMVLENKDSTAHGEITAIRNAEKALDSYDLSGCELYTTGEPCPMQFAIETGQQGHNSRTAKDAIPGQMLS